MKKILGNTIKLMVATTLLLMFTGVFTYASTDFVVKENDEGKKVLTEYKGDDSKVVIPSGVQVVDGFKDNKTITEVVLPDTVCEIKHSAFSGCNNLKKITFSKKLTRIEPCAFLNCSSLKKITINKKLKYIGEYAFYGCSALKKVSVEKGNKYFVIYKGALCSKKMKRLIIYPAAKKGQTKFVVPESIKIIEDGAFYKNKYIKKIYINGKTNFAGDFQNAKSLEKVVFKKGYKGFPNFKGCKKLQKVVLAEGTKRIGESQFEGCISLQYINFPSSLETIDEFAFKDCNKVIKELIPSSVSVNENAFGN